MLNRENYLILFLCTGLIPSLFGQTIIDDVNSLVEAKQIIEERTNATSDSMLIRAAADILTVLNVYQNPINPEKDVFNDWRDLRNIYYDNPLLNNFFKHKKIELRGSIWRRAQVLAKNNMRRRKKEPRALALGFLNAETAISPSDYLSVRNTLNNYQTTPNVRIPAVRIQNATVNQKVSNNELLSAKIPFVEELFEVIIKRASREVVVSYLEKILNRDIPNLHLLFPQVAEEFKEVEINYSNSFIERLRQTFYEDLKTLSLRLPELMLTEEYFKPLQTDPIAYNFLALYTIINLSLIHI